MRNESSCPVFVPEMIKSAHMRATLLLGMIVIGLVTGCVVPSLGPLFEDEELIKVDGLMGNWSQDGKDAWTFDQAESKYKLTHVDEKKRQSTYDVLAGKIGTNVFLDFILADFSASDLISDMEKAHLLAGHLFFRADQTTNGWALVPMDREWLTKYLKENPTAVPHFRRKEELVLTGNAAELQKFVAAHARNTNAFKEGFNLASKKR